MTFDLISGLPMQTWHPPLRLVYMLNIMLKVVLQMYSKMPTKPKICIFFRFGLPSILQITILNCVLCKTSSLGGIIHVTVICLVLRIAGWGHYNKYNFCYTAGRNNEMLDYWPGNLSSKGEFACVFIETSPIYRTREERYNWSISSGLPSAFAPVLNNTEYSLYVDMLVLFKRRCEEFNITYWLEAGSLYGAYKYHGFIPWDDDIDVKVDNSQRAALQLALESVEGYAIIVKPNGWKFYSLNSNQRKRKGGWPFIDIFFFYENATHIMDGDECPFKRVFAKIDIYPLQLEIFENHIFPVPAKSRAYLEKRYGKELPCKSNKWNHRKRWPMGRFSVDCKSLSQTYASVHRFEIDTITYKQLRLGNKTLYTIRYPIQKP